MSTVRQRKMTVIQKEFGQIVLVRIEGSYVADGAVVVTSDKGNEMEYSGLVPGPPDCVQVSPGCGLGM